MNEDDELTVIAERMAAVMLEERFPGWRRSHYYEDDGTEIIVHWEHTYFVRDALSGGDHVCVGTCLTLNGWNGSDIWFYLDPEVGHHVERILVGSTPMVCRVNGLADNELPEAIALLLRTSRAHSKELDELARSRSQ